MRVLVDRMTCWELLSHIETKVRAWVNEAICDEHDFVARETLFQLLAAIEEAEYALRKRAKEIAEL